MRISEQKLLIRESEERPNRYVCLAITAMTAAVIIMILLNEAGIFHVQKMRMRISCTSAIALLELSLLFSAGKRNLRNPRTKYMLLAFIGAAVLIICSVLSFHATLVLLLPLLLSAQYPSVRITRVAFVFSLIAAFLAPPAGIVLGTWDTEFVAWLAEVGSGHSHVVTDGEPIALFSAVCDVLLYVSLPHAIIILCCYPLCVSIARNNENRLQDQLQVLHMSESDALTGLLNRLSYEKFLAKPHTRRKRVDVIYVDANGLHALNNERGHAEGDKLLICVADRLRDAYGNECVYRTGGDEFITIVYDLEPVEVISRLNRVRKDVEAAGYSISAGVEGNTLPCTLQPMVRAAESKMMDEKQRYHREREK